MQNSKFEKFSNERGFIKLIIIFLGLVLILSAFGINLRGQKDTSSESALKSNISIIIETGKIIWTDYIARPVKHVWSEYVRPFVTGQFLSGLKEKQIEQTTLPPG